MKNEEGVEEFGADKRGERKKVKKRRKKGLTKGEGSGILTELSRSGQPREAGKPSAARARRKKDLKKRKKVLDKRI